MGKGPVRTAKDTGVLASVRHPRPSTDSPHLRRLDETLAGACRHFMDQASGDTTGLRFSTPVGGKHYAHFGCLLAIEEECHRQGPGYLHNAGREALAAGRAGGPGDGRPLQRRLREQGNRPNQQQSRQQQSGADLKGTHATKPQPAHCSAPSFPSTCRQTHRCSPLSAFWLADPKEYHTDTAFVAARWTITDLRACCRVSWKLSWLRGVALPVCSTRPGESMMTDDHRKAELSQFAIDLVIRLALVAGILYGSLLLLRPIAGILLWSVILAVAAFPLFMLICRRLHLPKGLSAALLSVVLLALLVVPAAMLGASAIETLDQYGRQLTGTQALLPPPPKAIRDWPLVGQRVFDFWQDSANNVRAVLRTHVSEIASLGRWIARIAAGVVFEL